MPNPPSISPSVREKITLYSKEINKRCMDPSQMTIIARGTRRNTTTHHLRWKKKTKKKHYKY
jgi:hypothetical protein